MTRGTKSVIFGVHNPLIHGIFVCISWILVYGRFPRLHELTAIFFHDIGYIGCLEMDGPDGETHPERSTKIIGKLSSKSNAALPLMLFHSRTYSDKLGQKPSDLCLPDKLSTLLYPEVLYIALGRLSGEIDEYKHRMGCHGFSDIDWLRHTKKLTLNWSLQYVQDDSITKRRIMRYFRSKNIENELDLAFKPKDFVNQRSEYLT